MHRRKFIRDTCTFCASSFLLGNILSGCTGALNLQKVEAINDEIIVPLHSFGENNYLVVRCKQISNDIFIFRKSDNSYIAHLMKCSHRDAPLQYSSKGLVCNEHGSRFNFDGEVVQAPATASLTKIPVSINEQSLILKIKHL
jgi:cytochrome b6-f complex iron-sulfur subunit